MANFSTTTGLQHSKHSPKGDQIVGNVSIGQGLSQNLMRRTYAKVIRLDTSTPSYRCRGKRHMGKLLTTPLSMINAKSALETQPHHGRHPRKDLGKLATTMPLQQLRDTSSNLPKTSKLNKRQHRGNSSPTQLTTTRAPPRTTHLPNRIRKNPKNT